MSEAEAQALITRLESAFGWAEEAGPSDTEWCERELAAARAAMLAALTKPPPEWRPIATAPKDATRILAIEGDDQCVVRWLNGEWRDYSDYGASGSVLFEPTHWMPLADPPAL